MSEPVAVFEQSGQIVEARSGGGLPNLEHIIEPDSIGPFSVEPDEVEFG